MAGRKMALIVRSRLLKALDQAPRFALICGPAGFGKTVLLNQYEEKLTHEGSAVLRLDLAQSPPDEAELRAAFQRSDIAVLLIDNGDGGALSGDTGRLIERLARRPGAPRLVLAGRGDPELPLARHRAAGDVLDIGPSELLFDAEEQKDIARSWEEMGLPARQVEQIVAAAAAWPCGFGLQFHSLQSGTAPQIGSVLAGSWRIAADYFEQEVLTALPEDLRQFLTEASALEQVTADDCADLLDESGSAALLAQAHALGAPVWPTDPEHRCYAVLPLFRQFLRAVLGEEDAARLGLRAARLLEEKGRFREACVQALAFGDHELAAHELELQLKADYAFREDGDLVILAERIDPGIRQRHPFILLALAQALTFRFEFERARHDLDQARRLVAELAERGEIGDSELRTLEMLLLHREMVLALGQHELARAQEYGDRLLQDMQHVPPLQRVMILNSLTYAQQELYIFRGAERFYVQAKTLIPELDSWTSSVPLETFYARHLFQTGRTEAAVDLLEATLARLVEELGPRPVLGSIAAVVLAEIKIETGELEQAAQLLDDYGGNVEQFGLLPMTLAARIGQARLHMANAEYDRGLALLERSMVGPGELFESISRALTVERVRWLLRLERIEAARIACNGIGMSLARPPELHSSAGAEDEAFALAWIQLARANNRVEDAIHLAQKWQRYTEGVGAVRSNVRWNVVLAGLRILAEEPSLAMRHLRRAVSMGASGTYRATFLAEADLLADHFAKLMGGDVTGAERDFLASLTGEPVPSPSEAFAPGEISVPLGAFSRREAAILRLVAKGMLNREIGEALGMTEGTVKWYLQRIYDKLGVRRRSQVALVVSQWSSRPGRGADALH